MVLWGKRRDENRDGAMKSLAKITRVKSLLLQLNGRDAGEGSNHHFRFIISVLDFPSRLAGDILFFSFFFFSNVEKIRIVNKNISPVE